ncbi:SLC13 family permease [Legionella longbeachae]|uniref:Putative arsenite efflux membrane component-like protein n=1 Tax=Legionella longbeachae serogroup 1 (strain NSW150) TaxID=661367 RepID=D3HMI2_LEGLN|nr:SLC13 family permease [Legionella longbeachae]VEE04091.1 arsenite efflux membrane component-like protein [Legionella oakridgensis]HBD7396950.1 anion transporter [Legionella pneumophila]ARB93063.1 anion transporter [Legionella longbeachae]ARM33875.1 anion transporter [Legionella longbeachae]EEZ96938.1 anione permease-like protein [Legionella longbeachae D-4968]
MPIAVLILLIVLVAIALRHLVKMPIPIWGFMTIGALASILFQQISPLRALSAIEPDVMFYLFGMFLICQAAEESGYLERVTDRIFFRAVTGKHALLVIVFVLGFSAALLMNDTIAIVGTPIILQLGKSQKHITKPLLFALAFAITIGSVISPIGNPQNLLIAVQGGLSSPFLKFVKTLIIPTLINLIVTYFFIYFIYKHTLNKPIEKPVPGPIKYYPMIILVKISLVLMLFLVFAKIITDVMHTSLHINFSYIALIAAVPILLCKQRWILLKQLDWGTLLFFASTFILIQSVWDSGFFQTTINQFHLTVTQIPAILFISLIFSQFLSNVPLVALYLPLLINHHAADSQYLALAAGSTIAGNLSIIGAASNIIIIQSIEKRGMKGFGFFEFIKVGVPLTAVNMLIYTCFL